MKKDIKPTLYPVTLTFQQEEQRKEAECHVVKKLDRRLMPILGIMYLLSFLDRVNVGNARLVGLEDDLKMSSHQYFLSLSIFFVGYCLLEVPSNMLLRKMGPRRWLGRIMISWGIISTCMAAVQNFESLMVCRVLLGIAEAGLVPGIVFYLSHWYRKHEIAVRVAYFFCTATVTGAFSGLLAFAISHMDGVSGLSGWRWIFLLEGIPTILFGLLVYFILPNNPSEASFLDESERLLAVARLKEDNIDVEDRHFSKVQFFEVIKDKKLWALMVAYLGLLTPMYSICFFLPHLVRKMNFDVLQAQLLSSPPYILASIGTVAVAFYSDRTQSRSIPIIASAIVAIIGFVLLCHFHHPLVLYFTSFIVVCGVFPYIPPTIGWLSNNVVGQTRMATATGMLISFGNIGGAIGVQLYWEEDAPYFIKGHLLNAGFLIMSVCIVIALRYHYLGENKRKDQEYGQPVPDAEILSECDPNFRYTI